MNKRFRAIGSAWLLMLAAMCCPRSVSGQYVYTLSNSASYYDSYLPGYGIAQGSLMVIFGFGLGPVQLKANNGFPLPLELGGTSIKVTVNGVTVNAPIVYTSAVQVAALLPSSTPVGQGTLLLTYNGTTAYPADITVVGSAFGIYSLTGNGLGAGVITAADSQIRSLADSFRPNDVAVLWGTGLGAVPGGDTAAPQPGNRFPAAEVYIGNQAAKVLYAGRSGCCAGLDQINFEVPSGAQGCFVPVAVRSGGVTSNFVTIPVASGGGPCSDPVGVPADLLRAAQSGQVVRTAAVGLGPVSILQADRLYNYSQALADTLSATLRTKITKKQVEDLLRATSAERRKSILELVKKSSRNTLDRVNRLRKIARLQQGMDQQGSVALFEQAGALDRIVAQFGELLPPPGSCVVFSSDIANAEGSAAQKRGLDAGLEIVLSGPLGTRSLSGVAKGRYQTSFGGGFTVGQLPAGAYSVSSAGGADVGPFTAALQVTNDLRWTNKPRPQPWTAASRWRSRGLAARAQDILYSAAPPHPTSAASTGPSPVSKTFARDGSPCQPMCLAPSPQLPGKGTCFWGHIPSNTSFPQRAWMSPSLRT